MSSNYAYWSNAYHYGYSPYHPYAYTHAPYYDYSRLFSGYPTLLIRQQTVRGQASWTNGGQITKCNIPWSRNQYMTAAVGTNSPYKCGQILKIRNLSVPGSREIVVTIVDQVPGYPPNKINLHRRAFEALGATTDMGVINVEIEPSPELEEQKWGKYLLEVTQTAYPGYNVRDYQSVGKTEIAPNQIQETFDFVLQSPQETIKVRGNVVYNPNIDRIVSFDIKEI